MLWKEMFLPLAIIACTPWVVYVINYIQGFLEWRKELYSTKNKGSQ